ncbi:hypothetical protein ACQ4PT_052562 [Festuca glaucescens]
MDIGSSSGVGMRDGSVTESMCYRRRAEEGTLGYGHGRCGTALYRHHNPLRPFYFSSLQLFMLSGAASMPNTYAEFKLQYLQDYIAVTLNSSRSGSNVQIYFVRSFLDMIKYLFGYK